MGASGGGHLEQDVDRTRGQEKVVMIYAAPTSGEPAKRRQTKTLAGVFRQTLTPLNLEELLAIQG